MIATLLTPLLENAINKVLQMDPAALPRLQALEGSSLALHIKPLPSAICLRVIDARLCLETSGADCAETCAVTISGDLSSFIESKLNPNQIRAGQLQISGDIGSAQRWQQLFADLQPDWEESLSRYVGDIAAHQIANGLRGLQQWSSASLQHLASSAAQYAQEERGWIVSAPELKHFINDVDALRDDVERLLAKARSKGIAL